MSVEGQAEEVGGVLGGAVGLSAATVLNVVDAEGRPPGVAGRGPHYPGGVTCLA